MAMGGRPGGGGLGMPAGMLVPPRALETPGRTRRAAVGTGGTSIDFVQVGMRGMSAGHLVPLPRLQMPRPQKRRENRRLYGPGAVKMLDVVDGQVRDGAFGLVTSADCNASVPKWVAVPASASAPGTAGQMAYASGFLYVCVADSTWQRVAISTF